MAIEYPLLSIIIPTYNRAHLLKQALKSIQNQTFKDYEIIIVNDGSKDNTDEIVSQSELNINYIKQKNAGLNAARNVALKQARGKYIALLDDDDLWLDFKSGLQIKILEKYPHIAYIFSDFYIFNETNKLSNGLQTWFQDQLNWDYVFDDYTNINNIIKVEKKNKIEKFYTGNIYFELLKNPLILPSTVIFRKSILKNELKFYEKDSLFGDWDFFARLAKNHLVGFIPFETTLNRSHVDDVRITKMPEIEQIKRRLDLIYRVWEKDEEFYKTYYGDIIEIRSNLLIRLIKKYILQRNMGQAKFFLKELKIKNMEYKKTYYTLLLLIYIPLLSYVLYLIYKLKSKIFY